MEILLLLLTLVGCATLQTSQTDVTNTDTTRYNVSLTVNSESVDWQAVAPAQRDGDMLVVDTSQLADGDTPVTLSFVGGQVDLRLADVGSWQYSHVLGTRWLETSAGTYTVHATVRHFDQGWDNYANIFQVVPVGDAGSVDNGVRELLHPHDNEQPFTRSQANVSASGQVRVESADNVEGWGGSTIVLDVDALEFPFDLAWQLTPQ
ncbi:MAG: hypothetical protein AAF708_00595 [Deinococcota bacterium]